MRTEGGADRTFTPRWRNGHWMTVYAWAKPRKFPRLPPPEDRCFTVAADTQVLARCHWQSERTPCTTLVALHGLEGSSDTHYMRGLADKAFAAGLNVVRLNQRNCGGTEQLGPGLYHSGLTADVDCVIRELIERDGLASIAVAGYSLGGNLALKLAGDYGASPPPQLTGVAAVSPTMDLERCVRALERESNAVYQWNFVRNLHGRMRRKDRLWPGRFPIQRLREARTIRAFDEIFTAPHHGFQGASDYYHRASAMRVIDRIRVPALILTAEDDPFVPVEPFRDPAVAGNPHVTVIVTKHGGHCGFIAADGNGDDGYWAERMVVEFVRTQTTGTRNEERGMSV
jgi:predicted alpha/beta-fold hydrolase